MNAVDFFQNGGAGWKHARRSDWGGWNVDGLVKSLYCRSHGAAGCKPARRAQQNLIAYLFSSLAFKY